MADTVRDIIEKFRPNLAPFEDVYKDLHQNPELSCQESRTATVVGKHLFQMGFKLYSNIGGHGVAAMFQNGKGPTIMLRAELDALPLEEKTNLTYASTAKQVDADGRLKSVMHACGHDMHMACLLAASKLLHNARQRWTGTLICLFQTNEERLLGAKAMVEDGLYDRIPVPDICLAQHLIPIKSGTVALKSGRVLGAIDSMDVRIFGKGTHSATPQLGVDPVVLASSIVVRLQSIVAREMDPLNAVVITCASFHGGEDASIIPEHVDIKIDIRSFSEEIRQEAFEAAKRIIMHESEVAGSPKSPRITLVCRSPPTDNDVTATDQLTQSLRKYYGDKSSEKVLEMRPDIVCDDFVILAYPLSDNCKAIPYVYWNFGATDPATYDKAKEDGTLRELPCNHRKDFAPAIQPTMNTDVDALAVAALTFLHVK